MPLIPHHFKSYLLVISLLLTATFSTLALALQDANVVVAEVLMRKGDFKGAYQLLEPLETARAGDIDYDYVFGVAAVDSNNAARGAIALERVLAKDNKHKNARAAIDKAHAVLGTTETAKIGVNRLTQQNTDAETKKATEASQAVTQDSALIQADGLIRKGDFNAAYQLLEPLEPKYAGDINYDYLLGIAAVESNNVTRGAFALERVLALDPSHKDARAVMAKAHYMLGETEASKAEFNHVLKQNPDAETKKTITKLLTSMDKNEGITTTYGAYLDAGFGWDSNVSSAPGIPSISLPGFIRPIDLGNAAQEKSDSFMNLAAVISVRHPVTDEFAVFGNASVTGRFNSSETDFNNSLLDFNAGYQYQRNKNNFSLAAQNNYFELNNESFRHAFGATAQWLYNIDAFNQAGVYGQFSRLKYNASPVRNADRSILGVNVGHVFQGDFNPVVFGSIYGGREDARDSSVDFLDQDVFGLRAGGQLSFSPILHLNATVSYEQRDNDANDPFFLTKRQDDQYDVLVGLRYFPAPSWTIRPQFSYTNNDSNIDLFGYERKSISVNVRKDFSW